MNTNSVEHEQDVSTEISEARKRKPRLIARVILCVLVIGAGILVKMGLTALREPPHMADLPVPAVKVDVERISPKDYPVVISGYGEVRALDSVAIIPKVAGEVVYVHPDLEVGKVIPEGELLFRIDQRDYIAAQAQGRAQVERIEIMVKVLNQQYEDDTKRLETLKRTRDIAREEFNRDRTLYEKEDVGSESMVNLSEINYRKAEDAFDQVQNAIGLYPLRIREAEAGLSAAKAALQLADLSLERTEEYAPFKARIQHKQIEEGQAVAPGVVALLLANDSGLEISVPLDSLDARKWLPFEEEENGAPNWFRPLQPVQCTLTWTEDPKVSSTGTLHRVERFDPMTRTVTVAIRIAKDTSPEGDRQKLPLVEGMYCSVEIPGNDMHKVYKLPAWSVSYDGKAYVAEEKRLRRRDVNVVRVQGDYNYVDTGLEPGDLVITTRLVEPVPGLLLAYDMPAENEDRASDSISEAAGAADDSSQKKTGVKGLASQASVPDADAIP